MRIKCSLLAILLLQMAPGIALAQTRTLTGTVVDSLTRQPLTGARISVRGMALGTQTSANGTFALPNVPQDEVILVVRRIGYRPIEVRAARDAATVNVALGRDLFKLDEVVVTGQVTSIQRRNLANAISTVNADDLERVPAQSVEHALQGKVVGANIQSNSGAPGGGVQVQLRGVTSINGASEPLYVVDGVVVSNVAIPSNQNAVTRAAAGSNPALTQDAQVNRIADLNPNDIETIEVLKGASAAAIYGSRASNGVIIITTRKGRSGKAQMNLTQRVGVSELSNSLGSRTFTSVADAVEAFGPSAANYFQPGVVYDQEELLAGKKPAAVETLFDLSGGDDNTKYFIAGGWRGEGGIIDNTGYQKRTLRANIDQDFGTRLNFSIQSQIIRSLAQRGLTNNDNTSVSFWMVFPFTPSFVDLRQQADGTYPKNPFVASNPLQTAALMKNDETVSRYIASGRMTFHAVRTPSFTLRFVGNGGADYFQQENSLLFPPDLQFEGDDGEPGTALLSNSNNLNLNGGVSAIATFNPSGGSYTSTTSAGVTAGTRDLRTARVVSRNLIGGLAIVSAGTDIQVVEQRQRVEDYSLFAQEEFLLWDKLLLTAGLNADRSSVNSDTDKYFVYPKGAASYRFVHPIGPIDELKIRAAVGLSGNQPLFGQKFTPMIATQTINGLAGLVVQGNVAAEDLHPERQREIEGGFDLALLDGRASVE
ncbi:MAG TPA: TonB-dependent receptor, partial [Gemmatimonadaceae bacterium]|nr:TonB-dependent receptor [Gemmatimonadaceae bacterium]